MKTTKELYGISSDELNAIIGKEMVEAHYKVRIRILRRRLNIILQDNASNPYQYNSTNSMVEPILKAIEYWENMLKGV